jgi:hypothetical protein
MGKLYYHPHTGVVGYGYIGIISWCILIVDWCAYENYLEQVAEKRAFPPQPR